MSSAFRNFAQLFSLNVSLFSVVMKLLCTNSLCLFVFFCIFSLGLCPLPFYVSILEANRLLTSGTLISLSSLCLQETHLVSGPQLVLNRSNNCTDRAPLTSTVASFWWVVWICSSLPQFSSLPAVLHLQASQT